MNDRDFSEELEERFQVLENKAVHQEHLVDELNGVVTQQQDQIDSLTDEVKRLRKLLGRYAEDTIDGGEEPPPPHY